MEETTDETGSSCDQLVVIPHPTVARFVHRPTTPPSHVTHTPRPCSEQDPHCNADSTPTQPADVSGGTDEHTRPQTVTETPSRCSPKMTAPTPSLAADRTLAEPYTTRPGRMVKQRIVLTFRLVQQHEGPGAIGPTTQ